MCGILGYAGFSKRKDLTGSIEYIRHRGPDGYGAAYFDGVALASTRLSIIDLSDKGSQPMYTPDKRLCIVFNGEIYNYREVKASLVGKYKFRSGSDTEVILYAYREWGTKCLSRLDGMFSFVIFDLDKDMLFGAHDRLGQKPLKYYFKNGNFVFASEIKAILDVIKEKPDIDRNALDNFLTLQYIPSPATGFQNIFKLPPAHYFVYKNRKLMINKYWHLDFTNKVIRSEDEWCALLYSELNRAVNSHLVSDVPVGALLSGGLDSSLVVALMTKNYKDQVQTFNVAFSDDKFDESGYAKIVAKIYKTKHKQIKVSDQDLMKNIKNLSYFYDEPIGDNSILPTYLISKLAASSVKVALAGDGGDENLAGYDRYNFVEYADHLSKLPKSLTKLAGLYSKVVRDSHETTFTDRQHRFLNTISDKFPRRYINYNRFFDTDSKRNLYTREFLNSVKKNDTFNIFKSLYNSKLGDLDNALAIDIATYLPDDLLYKTDIASMAVGLELRAPFLDHSFMEMTASIPANLKIKNGTKKYILKKMAKKYNLLPDELIFRKKQGFTIPKKEWFGNKLKDFVLETVTSKKMAEIFDADKLRNYIVESNSSLADYSNNIFAMMMLGLWLERYN